MYFMPQDKRRFSKGAYSSNSFKNLSNIDHKKEVSREKQKSPQLINRYVKQLNSNQYKNKQIIDFKTSKCTVKNQFKSFKNVNDVGHHKKSKLQSNPVQVNLNIQNTIPTRRLIINQARSERSLSNRQKQEDKNKKSKVQSRIKNPSNSTLDDIQCTQQLQPYTKEVKINKRMIFGERIKSVLVQRRTQQATIINKNGNKKNRYCQPEDLNLQIKQFEEEQKQINIIASTQLALYLQSRYFQYEVDPLYIEKKQKHLTWNMRAILIDWMIQVSYQFGFKRQTLYLSVNFVDKYFQNTLNLPKSDFQLVGATSLFIAAKLQEPQPKQSYQFSLSTKQRYNEEDIKQMQIKICMCLNFLLNPPTLYMWANKVMQQWDIYIDTYFHVTHHAVFQYFQNRAVLNFKKIDSQSYKNFRQVTQYLDCALLDIQTVQYKPKILVCSLIYLVIGKQLGQIQKKRIYQQFPRTSRYFLEQTEYNNLFALFLQQCFGLTLFQILPSVQYLASFFNLPLNYEQPIIDGQRSLQTMNLQEYCSFQTYNTSSISVVNKRFRGIYS